jgi:hypothetical protein
MLLTRIPVPLLQLVGPKNISRRPRLGPPQPALPYLPNRRNNATAQVELAPRPILKPKSLVPHCCALCEAQLEPGSFIFVVNDGAPGLVFSERRSVCIFPFRPDQRFTLVCYDHPSAGAEAAIMYDKDDGNIIFARTFAREREDLGTPSFIC